VSRIYPAKRGGNNLGLGRGLLELREFRPRVVRLRQRLVEPVKGREVPGDAGRDDFLDAVIPGDVDRIEVFRWPTTSAPPASQPILGRRTVLEQAEERVVVTEMAEREGEIRLVSRHALEQGLDQRPGLLRIRRQPDLAGETGDQLSVVEIGKFLQHPRHQSDRLFLIL
jgi:hypothetical protein